MPAYLSVETEVDAPKDASGWACDFTCPEHGAVFEVVETGRDAQVLTDDRGRAVVATLRTKGKGPAPLLFASHCPWCGAKYED